jgi:hypothetical protein
MASETSPGRWQDKLVLILGLWIVVSPFVFGYPYGAGGAINAYCSGILMVILAAIDLSGTYPWAVGINFLLGIWLIISPWVVNGLPVYAFDGNEISVGILALILLVWEFRADPKLHTKWGASRIG